jgi:uncharacterized protein
LSDFRKTFYPTIYEQARANLDDALEPYLINFVWIGMQTKSKLKRIVTHIVGWMFILVGIAGLVLPILQGILFILIGLFVLSSVSPWASTLLHKVRKRFPRIMNQVDLAKSKASKVQDRISARFDRAMSMVRKAHSQVFKRKSTHVI